MFILLKHTRSKIREAENLLFLYSAQLTTKPTDNEEHDKTAIYALF